MKLVSISPARLVTAVPCDMLLYSSKTESPVRWPGSGLFSEIKIKFQVRKATVQTFDDLFFLSWVHDFAFYFLN
jgi:hypothetical protein